jgi:hypothetical protein
MPEAAAEEELMATPEARAQEQEVLESVEVV